ncbi:transcriptional regulator, TetR family [Microbacterium sp. cf046]|uniref:TetR/AcrR family transcriptional regulator n=1 Tax=Microbacterium sp. cf046 TaxID=1761803 RepID=UPI0008E44FD2|nr:TetR/AcrR family transcriptional regulator [Microbacterium sp. cf046]SFS14190.1 transcriptional regulator, TetR family [Microbacterium sp. cf046]
MARPSVAEERRQQIIDAAIRTIGTHGITGATLDRIAEEAGMSRGHVRHFVGNRDELLVETARRFYFDGPDEDSILPSGTNSVAGAIDFLFGDEFTEPGNANAVVFGLIEASRTNPAIAQILVRAYSGVETKLGELIAEEHPAVSDLERKQAAYAIVSMALHNVFMNDIEQSDDRTDAARDAALALWGALARSSEGA